ncbi:lovastatin nonaketide synthase [Aspergillus luchuensis]|uniref:Lovastatin nonaketide synthase n=1 Tax=Aspergillus kawachii TaxID=1069201 RepID=A0A146FBT6_ASPKA|nr:lovastatin nonaketide synthase [Aspergillus luchuensis]
MAENLELGILRTICQVRAGTLGEERIAGVGTLRDGPGWSLRESLDSGWIDGVDTGERNWRG